MSNIKLVPYAVILIVVLFLFPGRAMAANRSGAIGSSAGPTRTDPGEVVSFSLPINVPEASLYAGPGSNFYVTGKLAQNEQVEIFMRRSDGWCAVRPPQGSFSWINAHFVRRESDRIGIITQHETEKEVPVRVGTDSVVKSSVIQVGLKNGKRVIILGETQLPGGAAWYKIVPPAGEFRWIQDNVLVQDDTIKQLPSKITMTREYLGSYMEAKTTDLVERLPGHSQTGGLSLLPESKANEPGQFAISVEDTKRIPSRSELPSGMESEKAPVADSSRATHATVSLPFDIPPMEGKVNNIKSNAHNKETVGLGTDEYSMEIARINRDLFSVVRDGGHSVSNDVLVILSDRAKALFNAAGSDDQRLAAKEVYDRIEQIKMSRTQASTNNLASIGSRGNGLTPSPTELPNTEDKRLIKPRQRVVRPEKSNSPSRLGFAFSSKSKPSHQGSTVAAPASAVTSSPGIQIADTRTQGHTHGRGKPIFGISPGPRTVPPHDYQIVLPPTVLPGPDTSGTTGPGNNISPDKKTTFMAQGQKPVLPGPLLDPGTSIKQVSATVPSGHRSESSQSRVTENEKLSSPESQQDMANRPRYDITRWRPPASMNRQDSVPDAPTVPGSGQFVPDSSGRKSSQGFDAMGVLGHLPAKPQGYPPYVLVENRGEQMKIICYVQAESGKSLDQFVGQTIGVKGTRGWLKGEGENRMVLTAKTIFALK